MLDSGANVTVIPLDLYEKLCNQSGELQHSNKELMGPCRQQIDGAGKIRVRLSVIVNSSHSAEAPCSSETSVQMGPLVHLRPLTPCSAGTSRSFETPDSLFSCDSSFI